MGLEDWGSLILRIALGAVFLHGAWFSGRDASSRAHLDAATAPVFPWHTELFARAGTAIAFIAGVSVLFGIFPRVGALLMALFLIPAALIHLGLKRHVLALKDKIAAGLGRGANPGLRADLDELGDCAALGHMTSALKNLALVGPALYLMLAGARGVSSDSISVPFHCWPWVAWHSRPPRPRCTDSWKALCTRSSIPQPDKKMASSHQIFCR